MRLSKRAEKIITRLQERVDGKTNSTPAFKHLSELFGELGIPHEFDEVIQKKDTHHTRNGLVTKKGTIDYKGFYLKVGDISVISSNAEYRRNPYSYVVKINEIVKQKLKENEKTERQA